MGILRRLREWREDKNGTLIGPDIDADSVKTEQINRNYHYAGGYDGADPDARLDNAVLAASNSDTIYLENATYSTSRTISKPLHIKGTIPTPPSGEGSVIDTNWTLDSRITISQILQSPGDNTFTLNSSGCLIERSGLFGNDPCVDVKADYCKVLSVDSNSTVNFQSGTSDGLVDASTRISVTDNGSNTVGDIA